MKPTVLVTGAGGYLGIPLCEQLHAAHYRVIAFDRFFFGPLFDPTVAHAADMLIVRGDIRHIERSLLEQVDAVIDLAGLSNDPAALLSSHLSQSINYDGACHLARTARAAGVRRYIYMSSASVYGRCGEAAADESSPCTPQSLYAQIKWRVERELQHLSRPEFQPVMLRNSTVFGLAPRMRYDLAINRMTLDACSKGVVTIDGNGRQRRPFIHVHDVATAVLAALRIDLERIPERIFNLGAESLNQSICAIAETVCHCLPQTRIQHRCGSDDARDYHLDFTLARHRLGFEPSRGIVDGIKEIACHLRNDGEAGRDPRHYTATWYQSLMEWEERLSSIRLNGMVL